MSWQPQRQQQHHNQNSLREGVPPLSRIQTEGESFATMRKAEEEEEEKSSFQQPQMGPPSQVLPSLNFRQLAPLRSPNLPSFTHSSSYFNQKRNRSTSESVANDTLRSLPFASTSPPNLPAPPSRILASHHRGEALPPLAAFGQPLSPGSVPSAHRSDHRSMKPSASTPALSIHPPHHHHHNQQQQQYKSRLTSPTATHSNYSSSFRSPTSSPQVGYYSTSASSRSLASGLSVSAQDSHYFSPTTSSPHGYEYEMDRSRESSEATMDRDDNSPRKLVKSHVPSACLNCKRAHLACDVSRPCRRCVNLGKTDTCVDVQHKKRGRPRLRDREAAVVNTTQPIDRQRDREREHQVMSSGSSEYKMRGSMSSASSSASAMRQSPRNEVQSYFPQTGSDGSTSYRPAITHSSSYGSILGANRNRSISSSSALQRRQGLPITIITNNNSVNPRADLSSLRNDVPPTVSLILSTDLQCARCSEESYALLGYSPTDLMERSLSDLVHPSERDRLETLWVSLIEPVGVRPQRIPASIDTVMSLSPAILMTPAPGTVYMQESMRLRQRSGIYDFYSIRLHLGGGLGADLFQPATLDRAYIVASLLKLGNDATHPDPSTLRDGKWHLGSDPRTFTTPQFRRSSGSSASMRSYQGSGGSSGAGGGGGVLPPPSAPPSYHSSGMSVDQEMDTDNNISSERDDISISRQRTDWQQQQQQEQHSRAEKTGRTLTFLPPPPDYTPRNIVRPLNPEESRNHHTQRSYIEKESPHLTHGASITTKITSAPFQSRNRQQPTLARSNGHSELRNGNTTVTSIPLSYPSRSESGGILC